MNTINKDFWQRMLEIANDRLEEAEGWVGYYTSSVEMEWHGQDSCSHWSNLYSNVCLRMQALISYIEERLERK